MLHNEKLRNNQGLFLTLASSSYKYWSYDLTFIYYIMCGLHLFFFSHYVFDILDISLRKTSKSKLGFVPNSFVTEVPDYFCFIQWSFTLINDVFVFSLGVRILILWCSVSGELLISTSCNFFSPHYWFSKRYVLFQDISLLIKHCLPRILPLIPLTLKSFSLGCLVGTCLLCQIADSFLLFDIRVETLFLRAITSVFCFCWVFTALFSFLYSVSEYLFVMISEPSTVDFRYFLHLYIHWHSPLRYKLKFSVFSPIMM